MLAAQRPLCCFIMLMQTFVPLDAVALYMLRPGRQLSQLMTSLFDEGEVVGRLKDISVVLSLELFHFLHR